MRIIIILLLTALLGGSTLATPVHAEEPAGSGDMAAKVQLESGKPAWASGWRAPTEPLQEAGFSMAFGLACCLALLCGGVWVAKRFGLVKMPNPKTGLKVLERTPVSAKTSLCLVEARGKQFLISVGSERVSLISNLSVDDSLESEQSFEEFVCDSTQPVTAC